VQRLRRPSALAALLVAAALLVSAVVVVATDARVDVLGPVVIFSVAAATVLALVLPDGRS